MHLNQQYVNQNSHPEKRLSKLNHISTFSAPSPRLERTGFDSALLTPPLIRCYKQVSLESMDLTESAPGLSRDYLPTESNAIANLDAETNIKLFFGHFSVLFVKAALILLLL